MSDGSRTNADWADLLKSNWEKLASSPYRDFFVASHAGWDEPEHWDAKAREDVGVMLDGFDPARLPAAHVLEIGCGVGRLGGLLAQEVASYTGIDIAPSMLAEARERCADRGDVRFFETDGLVVPEPARDRRYDLILAASVFIHCPRDVIASLVHDGYSLLAEGGRLRFHVLANPRDPGGFASEEEYARNRDALLAQMAETAESTTPAQMDLVPDEDYMGAEFGFDEVREFLREVTGGEVEATRLSIGHTAGWIVR